MDRHDGDKVLYIGPREDNAPEVAPSDQPVLHHHDSEGPQVKDDDTKIVVEKVETAEDKEVLTLAAPRRRRTFIWLGVSILTLTIGLSAGLGAGLRNRHEPIVYTNTTEGLNATQASSSPSPSISIETALATAVGSSTGCLEQANGNQSAICAEPGALCPDGYRSVRWNGGCPHVETGADWRCCV